MKYVRSLLFYLLPLFSEGRKFKIMTTSKSINKKVPGQVMPLGKLADEGKKFNTEIKKKNVSELKDILDRQNKLLQNDNMVRNLPDKGEKIRQRKQQLMVSLVQFI